MAALDRGDVIAALVGEDRLEAVAVRVGEGELGAGVGTLAANDQPRGLRPSGEVDQLGGLGDLAVSPLSAVLVLRRNPALIGNAGDRLAHLLGQVKADREADAALVRPIQELVTAPAESTRKRTSIPRARSVGICSSAASATAI